MFDVDPESERIVARVATDCPELTSIVRKVFDDYPSYTRNVFIMMRFKRTEQFLAILAAIRESLRKFGLFGIRADDKAYTDDLWLNICAYMWSCRYGIAVLEDIDERDFNPNIALEYGYMMGLGRRVLLLKEARMPKVPSDITGKLWKPFSVFDIDSSVRQQVNLWATDVGLTPIPETDPGYIPPIEAAPLVREILINQLTMASALQLDSANATRAKALLERLRAMDTQSNPKRSLRDLATLFSEIRSLSGTSMTGAGDMTFGVTSLLRGV